MKVEITQSNKNELLGRTEVTATITFSGATPRRAEVKKAIAASAGAKADFVVVKKIASYYGGGVADVTAYAYSDKDVFEKVEREYMRTRNAKEAAPVEETKESDTSDSQKESKPEGDTPAEEKAETTPKEESEKQEETDKPEDSKEEAGKPDDSEEPAKKDGD